MVEAKKKATAVDRAAENAPPRVLNEGPGPPDDGRERRSDLCPTCGGERWELVIVPDRFFCDECGIATVGPNTEAPERPPEQIDLFASNEGAKSEPADEGPPIDEGMAWVGEEGPDE